MKHLYNITVIIASAILFGFIAVLVFQILSKIFFAPDAEFGVVSIGAFMGAFLAFIFVRIGDAVKRVSDRQRDAYNSLVKLERIGNNHLIVSSSMIFIAKDILQTIENALAKNQFVINFNVFDYFKIDEEALFNLLNMDVLNKIFILNTDLKKLNHSIAALERHYSEINKGVIAKTLNPDAYFENLKGLGAQLKLIIRFAEESQQEIKKAIALVRVIISKEKPLFTKLAHWWLRSKSTSKYQELVNEESIKLDREIEEIRNQSRKRIDEILRK